MKHPILLLFIALSLFGCLHSEHKEKKVSPAKIETDASGEMPKVVLTPDAEKRLGIEVVSIQSTDQMPPSAVLYDSKGATWVYVRTSKQTYSRIHADFGQKNQSVEIVIHGASELYGAESGVGK